MAFVLSNIKWGASTAGTSGGQVLWSFATTPGDIGFDATITETAYQNLIRAAFQAWENVANIDFVEVSDGPQADIRLGWDAIDGEAGTVGEAQSSYFLRTGFDEFSFSEIRFDTAETWSTNASYVGPDTNFYATALHEIGHALGLDHSTNANAIMYFQTNATFNLTPEDIAGAQAIYGAAGGSGGGLIGGAGADVIAGTAAGDFIDGNGANDVLTGHAGDDTIEGGDGNDQLWAGATDVGNDSLLGEAGNDILGGGAGNDTLQGGTGSDLLFGGNGNDWLDVGVHDFFTSDGAGVTNTAWAGAGADRVDGDNTSDVLGGGSGNDAMTGYGGNDIFYGGKNTATETSNNDSIYGGDGNDSIYGGVGNDLIDGDAGNDNLFGGDGSDQLDGGTGNDSVWGGAGDDTLTGGGNNDVFGFAAGSGSDRVTDFALGVDFVDLSGTATDFTNAADVLAAASDTGGGLLIDLGGGADVVFANLSTADINSMDFFF